MLTSQAPRRVLGGLWSTLARGAAAQMSYTINTLFSFGQPRVTYSGLISGIDTGSIVKSEVAAVSQNQTLLLNGAAKEAQKATLYANIAGQLGTLDGIVSGLTNVGLFAPSSGTTSDPDSVAITSSKTAQTGTYAVKVTQLAQGQINNSANFVSATSLVASDTSGSVTLAVGSGDAQTFDLTDTTTLTDLADAINESGLAVQATVVSDSNGYHLSLASTGTGSSSALTIAEVNSNLDLGSHLVQSAQNAQGTLNGTAFSAQTNTTSSLIDGAELSFAAPTSGFVTVGISKDAAALAANVQAFVGQYNAVLSSINAATVIRTPASLDNLVGDINVQNVTAQLTHAVTSMPESASGTYHTLAEIGISLGRDGTLVMNRAVLNSAIATDATSVANLLANTSAGKGIAATVDAITSTYGGPAGILTQMSQAQATRSIDMTEAADDMQYAIDIQATTLRSTFVQMEVTMANLATQNQLVQAFANSMGVANNGQDNAAEEASPSNDAADDTQAATRTGSTLVTAPNEQEGQSLGVPNMITTIP